MSENQEPDWAAELGPLQDGDIELMEDAINALELGDSISVDHALHGLRRRVAFARALLAGGDQKAIPPSSVQAVDGDEPKGGA